jgi:antitoxin component YwqK of YwqJK toxin-antitoxin module
LQIIVSMRSNFFLLIILVLGFSVRAQTTDALGKKQGYWKKIDEKNKKLIYEGMFKDDRPVGKFIFYYPNDSVQAIFHYRNEGKLATVKLFHPTGKRMGEGRYVNNFVGREIERTKDSVWVFYDEAGMLISKDIYLSGKKNGLSLVYLPDGSLAEERNYKMDVQHGPFKLYFDGKKVKGEGNYVNGNLEGKCTYYYPNGIEVASGYYKDGKKNGPWIYKDEKGKIKEKELYRNGKQASAKETDEFFSKNNPKENQAPASGKSKENKPQPKTGSKK